MILELGVMLAGAAGYMAWNEYKGVGQKLRTLWRAGGLYNRDGTFPEMKEKKTTKYGYCLRLSLPPGMSTSDFIGRQKAIEEHLGHRIEVVYKNKNMFIKVFEQDLVIHPFEVIKLPEMKLPVAYTYGKQLVTIDFNREPHLMIAGETGGGKSTALRGLLTTLFLTKPWVKVHLVDLKEGVEMAIFERCRNVESFCDDVDQVFGVFNRVHKEIQRRYRLFREAGAVDIVGYNKKHKPGLPYIMLVIDEFAELMDQGAAGKVMQKLASKGRAAGLRLIISTQRPDRDVIDGKIKANIPIVLGLKTKNNMNSHMIIDEGGLEDLRGRGHGWLRYQGQMTELQTMELSEERVVELLKPVYRDHGPSTIAEEDVSGVVEDFDWVDRMEE